MKKLILALVVAGMVCVTSGAIANTSKKDDKVNGVAMAEQGKIAMQQPFSGVVKASGDAIFLETSDGVFRLEGIELKQFVGKRVAIIGSINSKDGSERIVVAKAAVTK